MKPPTIRVHIGRVIWKGGARPPAGRLEQAIEAAIVQRCGDRPAFRPSGANAIEAAAQAIAQAVHERWIRDGGGAR